MKSFTKGSAVAGKCRCKMLEKLLKSELEDDLSNIFWNVLLTKSSGRTVMSKRILSANSPGSSMNFTWDRPYFPFLKLCNCLVNCFLFILYFSAIVSRSPVGVPLGKSLFRGQFSFLKRVYNNFLASGDMGMVLVSFLSDETVPDADVVNDANSVDADAVVGCCDPNLTKAGVDVGVVIVIVLELVAFYTFLQLFNCLNTCALPRMHLSIIISRSPQNFLGKT